MRVGDSDTQTGRGDQGSSVQVDRLAAVGEETEEWTAVPACRQVTQPVSGGAQDGISRVMPMSIIVLLESVRIRSTRPATHVPAGLRCSASWRRSRSSTPVGKPGQRVVPGIVSPWRRATPWSRWTCSSRQTSRKVTTTRCSTNRGNGDVPEHGPPAGLIVQVYPLLAGCPLSQVKAGVCVS